MSDKLIADTTTTFHVGQTVVAKVTNLDEEKKRFLVTLKISEVTLPEGSAQTRLIHAVQERRAATEMIALKGGTFCLVSVIQPCYAILVNCLALCENKPTIYLVAITQIRKCI